MMNTGMTTKTWSNAVQPNGLKESHENTSSADEKSPYGDKDVGTVLNEIADPNWVDPSKVQRTIKKDLDRDAFFKLMLTQMKNQDPMNPMQSHEMAAQLAQFTSLEQLFNVNQNLEALKKTQTPLLDYQSLNFLGKEISADSSKIVRTKDDDKHEIHFDLGQNANETVIVIKDADGKEMKKLNFGALKKGPNKVHWNGFQDNGFKAPLGDYTFTIEAKSGDTKIAAKTEYNGKITGVQYTSKGPLLLIGNQTVYLSDVKKILDPVAAAPAPTPTTVPPGSKLMHLTGAKNPDGTPVVEEVKAKAVKPEGAEPLEATQPEQFVKPEDKKMNLAPIKEPTEQFKQVAKYANSASKEVKKK